MEALRRPCPFQALRRPCPFQALRRRPLAVQIQLLMLLVRILNPSLWLLDFRRRPHRRGDLHRPCRRQCRFRRRLRPCPFLRLLEYQLRQFGFRPSYRQLGRRRRFRPFLPGPLDFRRCHGIFQQRFRGIKHGLYLLRR